MSNYRFRGVLSPFHAVRENDRITVENEYVRCVHDLRHGGELIEAVILNGSGKNLFVKPQCTIVGTSENGSYHCYRSDAAAAEEFSLTENHGNPVLEFVCRPTDADGKTLPGLNLRHRIEYTPQGEALHQVTFSAERRIPNLGMVQIGTLFPAKRMDTLAVTSAYIEMPMPYGNSCRWYRLAGDATSSFMTRWVPNAMLVFQRGVEGFQFVRGDNLAGWESIGGTLPGFGMGFFSYRKSLDAYEMRMAPLDCRRPGQYLKEGDTVFDFSLAFPYVKEKMVPLAPCSGHLLQADRGFEKRWPTEEDLSSWESAGCTLMRLHNDGDIEGNGIFWRAAAYPPYPPEEMKKMDQTLAAAHRHHLDVVPYFSLHEYHPEAPGFAENAETWGRISEKGDGLIPSYFNHGYFGYIMCLKSGWMQKRRDTIDEVLRKHAFDGVYYDWCSAAECIHPAHGAHHWDFRELIEHLLWTYERVGKDGVMYLHQTGNPNIAAENLASLILTEETGPARIAGDMFSPHAHFMNICPRQVCLMIPNDSPADDLRRYAMCALLHHATVSSELRIFADFYREYAAMMRETQQYSRHTAPGEGLCGTSDERSVGMSAYWNHDHAMLVFANLRKEPQTADYHFAPADMKPITGKITVPPMTMRTLNVNIQ